MEITARKICLEPEPTEIYMDLEMIEEIYSIFSEINQLKTQLNDLSGLKSQYSNIVNGLCEVTIENSWSGEWMSRKALELGLLIRSSLVAYKKIKALEFELAEKYGFLHEFQRPAPDQEVDRILVNE